MFESYKKVSIDLSHLVGLTKLSRDYEIIDDDNEYQHRSIVNIDNDIYDFYYLNDDKLIVKFNDALYFLILIYGNAPKSDEEYDNIIDSISQDKIDFECDDGSDVTFNSLTEVNLQYGTEYVKESTDSGYEGIESDIMINIFESEHEYMINTIAAGEHLMYIGVEIKEGQIL